MGTHPPGGVEWGRVDHDGGVDVLDTLLDELEQEAGIRWEEVDAMHCAGLVHDVEQDGYNVCFIVEAPDAMPSSAPNMSRQPCPDGNGTAAY